MSEEPPHRNSPNIRWEINVPDEDLVTTVLRAAEQLAAPPHRHDTGFAPSFATPEDYNESVLPPDFDRLLSVVGHIHSLFAHDPRLARQASYAREAFGDGETLRILFQSLFPKQRSVPNLDSDGTPILTGREVDILREAACGITNEEIATRLNIALRTVTTHFSRIYKKLNVQRPMQAVARAISMGYLNLDVLDIIAGASHTSARNYRLFDTLVSNMSPLDQGIHDTTFRPLAEFGLLLMILAGRAAAQEKADETQVKLRHAAICGLDSRGKVIQVFGAEHLRGICGMAVAPRQAARQGFTPGHLFVVGDTGHPQNGLNTVSIREFTPEGRFIREFCGGREIGTRLVSGCATFHADGRLLVASGSSTDAILAFRRGGATVRRFANTIPSSFCVRPSGEIYMVHGSSAGNTIRVLDAAGKIQHKFGLTPAGVNYSGIVVNSQGHTWIIRTENEAVTLAEFAPDGTQLRTLSLPGLLFAHLAVDRHDRLYVPCRRSGDVKVLSPDGKLVHQFDLRGKIAPYAVAISDEGRIWVTGEIV